MLVAAQQHGCLREMLVIAAFLGIQDPRERPPEAREAADNAHAKFTDPRSEFIGILRLWEGYREAHEELTQSRLRDWCGRNFLGFLRMREWRELHRQLRLLCEELGWDAGAATSVQPCCPVRRPPRPVPRMKPRAAPPVASCTALRVWRARARANRRRHRSAHRHHVPPRMPARA
jgi:HrpA-like helicases